MRKGNILKNNIKAKAENHEPHVNNLTKCFSGTDFPTSFFNSQHFP